MCVCKSAIALVSVCVYVYMYMCMLRIISWRAQSLCEYQVERAAALWPHSDRLESADRVIGWLQ